MWTPLQFLERKMDMKLPLLGAMEHEGGGGGKGNKRAIQAPDLSLEGCRRRKNCLKELDAFFPSKFKDNIVMIASHKDTLLR